MIFSITKSRIIISRLFGLIILFLIFFTSHSFPQNSTTGLLFELSGSFLLIAASLGRLWALMYLAGNKRRELVTVGPYSMVRHPLYLFSLIGAVGIGLASENVLVLVLIILFYCLYYPFIMRAEEGKLVATFGQDYLEYAKSVPAFIPKLSLYKEPEHYQVKTAEFVRRFGDAVWFMWMFILLLLVKHLQQSGCLPVLLRIP
jgi:protein-S-isoprenylcysteine O-methyltransferase Ste14